MIYSVGILHHCIFDANTFSNSPVYLLFTTIYAAPSLLLFFQHCVPVPFPLFLFASRPSASKSNYPFWIQDEASEVIGATFPRGDRMGEKDGQGKRADMMTDGMWLGSITRSEAEKRVKNEWERNFKDGGRFTQISLLHFLKKQRWVIPMVFFYFPKLQWCFILCKNILLCRINSYNREEDDYHG